MMCLGGLLRRPRRARLNETKLMMCMCAWFRARLKEANLMMRVCA